MELLVERASNEVIVHVSGDLDATVGQEFEKQLRYAMESGLAVRVDAAGVTFLNCSASMPCWRYDALARSQLTEETSASTACWPSPVSKSFTETPGLRFCPGGRRANCP